MSVGAALWQSARCKPPAARSRQRPSMWAGRVHVGRRHERAAVSARLTAVVLYLPPASAG